MELNGENWHCSERNGVATLTLTTLGAPYSKANRRVLVRRGKNGPPMSIKSPEAREFTIDFGNQVRPMVTLLEEQGVIPLHSFVLVDVLVRYNDDRPDLDIDVVLDCLQQMRIILNDRHIRAFSAHKAYDAKRPGLTVTLIGVMANMEIKKRGKS